MHLLEKCLRLFSLIGVGAAAFFGVCQLLAVEEMREVSTLVARRLRRRTPPSPESRA